MNKFSEQLLANFVGAMSVADAQWTLVSNKEDQQGEFRWFDAAFEMIDNPECRDISATFICFLAAMSDRDLIEMNFTPGDSV